MRKVVVIAFSVVFLSGYVPRETADKKTDETKGARLRLDKELCILVRMDEYAPVWIGNEQRYFCNIAARDFMSNRQSEEYEGWFGNFLSHYGYDVTPVFPDFVSQLTTPVDVAYKKTLKAISLGKVKSLTAAEAQKRANECVVIWIIAPSWVFRLGHEAIVSPDERPFNHDWGVYVAQCGMYCCKAYARDSRVFGEMYLNKDILYVEFDHPGEDE